MSPLELGDGVLRPLELENGAAAPANGEALTPGEALELEAAVSAHVLGAGQDPGLGLLLEMARRGEFDPWNVDIVALTDRYLQALDVEIHGKKEAEKAQATGRIDGRDLDKVARLIFYAAALIHLKARALAEREARLAEERRQAALLAQGLDLAGDLPEGFGSRLHPDDLPLLYPDFMSGEERGALSLAPRDRPPRSRGVTLIDLIMALRSYDERLVEREALLAEMPHFDGETALDECVGSAHEDDLERDIAEVRQHLWSHLAEGARLELATLVTPARSRAACYLALLFLSQDEEVTLEQETFYGELFVVRGPNFGQVIAGTPNSGSWVIKSADDDAEEEAVEEDADGDPGADPDPDSSSDSDPDAMDEGSEQ